MDSEVISGLLQQAKERDAETEIVYSALLNAMSGLTPIRALAKAIRDYDDYQSEVYDIEA